MYEFEEVFNKEAQTILIYLGREVETDSIYKTKTKTYYNPIPIKAIVTYLIPSQIKWKMWGIETTDAKEIIVESRFEKLIKLSQKIGINGEDYLGWRENGKLQFRKERDYIRLYVYKE